MIQACHGSTLIQYRTVSLDSRYNSRAVLDLELDLDLGLSCKLSSVPQHTFSFLLSTGERCGESELIGL